MLFCENGAASMPGDRIQNEILAGLPTNEYERIFSFLATGAMARREVPVCVGAKDFARVFHQYRHGISDFVNR
jgi:hypothetical protein